MQSKELPAEFVVAMPDDALAPSIARGTRLAFARDATPRPGIGVLVRDAGGGQHIRRYGAGAGGEWSAQAINATHATLESRRDGLVLLAVMTGRLDGMV